MYRDNGSMALQVTAANRPMPATNDPPNRDTKESTKAYPTCRTESGVYEVDNDFVTDKSGSELLLNWQNTG